MATIRKTYDFIVVGAGPAGCAVAARLSRLPGRRVLLIEAGGNPRNPILSVPVAMMLTMTDPRYTWHYATEPEPGLGGRAPAWLAGRVLGGGSVINGMAYVRGQRHDYDRWRDLAGCAGWGYDAVLPFFRRAEASERGGGALHGGDGPIRISRGLPEPPIAPAFLAAMADCGMPLVDDLNAEAAEGFGYFDRAVGRGRRSSAARAYLGGIGDRRALDILTGAHATGLIIEHGRAAGIRFVRAGRPGEARAGAEVVLAAGCVSTTQLMLLSGLGPADALARLGIRPVADLPAVGQNLQNHVAFSLRYGLAAPITASVYRRPLPGARALLDYALFRRGVLAGTLCPVGGLLRTDPEELAADTQVMVGAGLPGIGRGRLGALPAENGFVVMINQGRPFSRGAIALRSADPLAPPLIRSGHLADARDRAHLGRAVATMRDLLARASIAGERPHELGPVADLPLGPVPPSLIQARAQSYYHAAGSCRMGEDPQAVVDTSLRVRGVEGLRISDTSVAPLLVNGNTGAMALMLGERAAALIEEAHR